MYSGTGFKVNLYAQNPGRVVGPSFPLGFLSKISSPPLLKYRTLITVYLAKESRVSFLWNLSKGNWRAILPVSRDVGFVPKQFADFAKLRNCVRAILIVPLVVARTRQRFFLLRQNRFIHHHPS